MPCTLLNYEYAQARTQFKYMQLRSGTYPIGSHSSFVQLILMCTVTDCRKSWGFFCFVFFTFYPLTESVELLHGAAVTLLTLGHCILFFGCHREGLLQGQHDFIHLKEKNLFHHAVFQLARVYPNLYQTTVLVYLLKTLSGCLHPVLYFDVIKSGQHKGNVRKHHLFAMRFKICDLQLATGVNVSDQSETEFMRVV